MAHVHAHSHSRSHLGVAVALTLGYAVVEGLGGWWSGSLALLADAGHMATDGAALGLAALAAWAGRRPASERPSFGLGRAEVVAGPANSLVIVPVVASNVPSNDTCLAGGYGWLNFFDYQTGSFIQGATLNMTSTKIAASLVVGINVVKLPGGEVKSIVTTADNQQLTQTTQVKPNTLQGRPVNWRELISQ